MTCSLDQWLKGLVPLSDIDLLTTGNLKLSPDSNLWVSIDQHFRREAENFLRI
jgi:hypothetical protein